MIFYSSWDLAILKLARKSVTLAPSCSHFLTPPSLPCQDFKNNSSGFWSNIVIVNIPVVHTCVIYKTKF